jgi:hypothetical protein
MPSKSHETVSLKRIFPYPFLVLRALPLFSCQSSDVSETYIICLPCFSYTIHLSLFLRLRFFLNAQAQISSKNVNSGIFKELGDFLEFEKSTFMVSACKISHNVQYSEYNTAYVVQNYWWRPYFERSKIIAFFFLGGGGISGGFLARKN